MVLIAGKKTEKKASPAACPVYFRKHHKSVNSFNSQNRIDRNYLFEKIAAEWKLRTVSRYRKSGGFTFVVT